MKFTERPVALLPDHVAVHDAYALSVWARHFNVTEQSIKDAVQIGGNHPDHVYAQLQHAHARSF